MHTLFASFDLVNGTDEINVPHLSLPSRHCLSCLTSLVATPAMPHPNCSTDAEEDTVNGRMPTFNHTHMRKAFQLMNDLRRCIPGTVYMYSMLKVISISKVTSSSFCSPVCFFLNFFSIQASQT